MTTKKSHRVTDCCIEARHQVSGKQTCKRLAGFEDPDIISGFHSTSSPTVSTLSNDILQAYAITTSVHSMIAEQV